MMKVHRKKPKINTLQFLENVINILLHTTNMRFRKRKKIMEIQAI